MPSVTTRSGNLTTSGINGVSIAVFVAGGILIYSGIKGAPVSKVIADFLRGSSSEPQSASDIADLIASSGGTPSDSSIGGISGEHSGGGGNPAANQAKAKIMATPLGWGSGDNWNALVALWTRESGWSNTADTRKSGAGGDNASTTGFAYGIAQARPYSKMPIPAWPPDKGGISDPTTQIAWGLAYIGSRYGNPVNALAHENANGWY